MEHFDVTAYLYHVFYTTLSPLKFKASRNVKYVCV